MTAPARRRGCDHPCKDSTWSGGIVDPCAVARPGSPAPCQREAVRAKNEERGVFVENQDVATTGSRH